MTYQEAQAYSKRLLERFRKKVLRQLKTGESKLDEEYRGIVRTMRMNLRGDESGSELRLFVERNFKRVLATILPILQAEILAGARVGNEAARRQALKIFGKAFEESFKSGDKEAFAVASKRIRGSTYVDKVHLSTRLWRNHKAVGRQMAAQIEQSIRATRNIQQAADDLLREVGRPDLKVPNYIERIAEKAKEAPRLGREPLERAIASHRKKLSGPINEFTIRADTQRFLGEISKAKGEQIDEVVEHWVTQRARKHARMIVRHETIEAYKDGYQESIADKDYVKGITWTLAPKHDPDECDILAKQNLYGLGPGGYPLDKVPPTPHPNDLCTQVGIVDVHHFKRIRAQKKGEPEPPRPWEISEPTDGAQWLATQDKKTQMQILGPSRQKIFEKTPNRVVTTTGKIRKLRNIQSD